MLPREIRTYLRKLFAAKRKKRRRFSDFALRNHDTRISGIAKCGLKVVLLVKRLIKVLEIQSVDRDSSIGFFRDSSQVQNDSEKSRSQNDIEYKRGF